MVAAMADQSEIFAGYLDDLLGGEGYWEDELVIMPKNLCAAVLSLLQHLHEERGILPESLVGPARRLNNAIGAALREQGAES
jgi:hypothetical protein